MKHSEETRQHALSLLQTKSVTEVAELTGISRQILYNWIRKYNIDYDIGKSRRAPALDLSALDQLIRAQPTLTEPEIASELGVTQSVVTSGIAKLRAVKVWCVPPINTQSRILNSTNSKRKQQRLKKLYKVVQEGMYQSMVGIALEMGTSANRSYQLCSEAEVTKNWCFRDEL